MIEYKEDNAKRKEFMEIFGRNIKRLRQEKKWTQEHLSLLVQVNYKYVYDIESGNKCASSWITKKIARAFGVTVDELMN